jgi:HK97 gp10 family phage protein
MNLKLVLPAKELLKIANKSKQLRSGLFKGVRNAMFFAESEAKKSFGKPGNLKTKTGHLRRSIQSKTKQSGDKVIGILSSNTVYSAIHEYGGLHPRSTFKRMPERPFLRPAIEDNRIEIDRIIQKAINEEVRKNARV